MVCQSAEGASPRQVNPLDRARSTSRLPRSSSPAPFPSWIAGRSLAAEHWLLAKLYQGVGRPSVRLQLWDGHAVGPGDAPHAIEVTDRPALYALLRNPNIAFGDLFTAGRVRITGDLVALLEILYRHRGPPGQRSGWMARLWRERAPQGADPTGARGNIQHHYDLGNAFYRLWLDRVAMQYTCAYFAAPEITLEQAQLAKLEHICRKLRLRPGQTVIEAGCGWGGLARYMAKRHGVRVRAFNISREQLAWAREQALREGLDGQIDYIEDDYRNITGECDAFVSVGMLEHVGPAHYPALAGVIQRCLRREGLGLIHTIGRNRPGPINGWIQERIFPGAYVPATQELMALFEAGSFSVLDLENLRLHYATTLEHWLARFLAQREPVVTQYGEAFARAWQLYLAGSLAAFRVGHLQLFQVVFAPGNSNRVPATRQHLYSTTTPPRPTRHEAYEHG